MHSTKVGKIFYKKISLFLNLKMNDIWNPNQQIFWKLRHWAWKLCAKQQDLFMLVSIMEALSFVFEDNMQYTAINFIYKQTYIWLSFSVPSRLSEHLFCNIPISLIIKRMPQFSNHLHRSMNHRAPVETDSQVVLYSTVFVHLLYYLYHDHHHRNLNVLEWPLSVFHQCTYRS